MKTIQIKKLQLINFRGVKEIIIDFNSTETDISGDNGTGKSTIFNAFCWLLFGKDSQDRKDFCIKPLVDGVSVDKVECIVSGVFDIDGEEIVLRRALIEDWVKPKGQIEQVFKGNQTKTYWNDTPLNVTEYQRRISEIIDESVFKMVTNPLFFTSMKWQDQREQLFQLAGTITDNEIAARNPEFIALLDKITGKSLTDFKRELSSRKKKLKEDLEKIQPRIDQTFRLMPEKEDFSLLEKEVNAVESKIIEIDQAIADKTKAARMQDEENISKLSKINDLKKSQQQVLFEKQSQARELAFAANANLRELENNIKATEQEISALHRDSILRKQEVNAIQGRVQLTEQEIGKMRSSWSEENAKEYNSSDVCSECGQLRPEEQREESLAKFNANKVKKLKEINSKGSELTNCIENLKKSLSEATGSLELTQKEIQSKTETIEILKQQVVPMDEPKEVNPNDIAEYVLLTNEIQTIESAIEDCKEEVDNSNLQNVKKELQAKRDEIKVGLANSELIEKYTKEINSLETQGKSLAQQIADTEREEYTMQKFSKAKIEECEYRINSLFTKVRFQLFDYTIDGNESEACIPLVDGVQFGTANTAGRINAGLDIINALIKFHGVSAPIFIDGRESINSLLPTKSQIINLVVSNEKKLTIK